MPKVSVIIPTYNCGQYIGEAIESVFSQTYKNFEVIIIDDGSTDNSKAIIEGYSLRYPNQIRYFYQQNTGPSSARNIGILEARGQYIGILDADDIWTKDHLEESVKILESDPGKMIVHSNISWMSERGEILGTPKRKRKFLSGHIFEHLFLRRADVAMLTVLVRKDCFERLGLFDCGLDRLGCEDREMWLRVARAFEFHYIDKVLGFYRIRPGSMSKNKAKMVEGRYYIVDKFCSERGKNQLLRRRALSKIHRDLADSLKSEKNFQESRKHYRKALLLWPFNIWAWLNYVKALLRIP